MPLPSYNPSDFGNRVQSNISILAGMGARLGDTINAYNDKEQLKSWLPVYKATIDAAYSIAKTDPARAAALMNKASVDAVGNQFAAPIAFNAQKDFNNFLNQMIHQKTAEDVADIRKSGYEDAIKAKQQRSDQMASKGELSAATQYEKEFTKRGSIYLGNAIKDPTSPEAQDGLHIALAYAQHMTNAKVPEEKWSQPIKTMLNIDKARNQGASQQAIQKAFSGGINPDQINSMAVKNKSASNSDISADQSQPTQNLSQLPQIASNGAGAPPDQDENEEA